MTAKTIEEVYEDRNALALAFARAVHEHHMKLRVQDHRLQSEYRAVWDAPPDADDADADEWAVIYCQIPTGQVSWHVPRGLVAESSIPLHHADWDGHDRDAKNQRLRDYAAEQ